MTPAEKSELKYSVSLKHILHNGKRLCDNRKMTASAAYLSTGQHCGCEKCKNIFKLIINL